MEVHRTPTDVNLGDDIIEIDQGVGLVCEVMRCSTHQWTARGVRAPVGRVSHGGLDLAILKIYADKPRAAVAARRLDETFPCRLSQLLPRRSVNCGTRVGLITATRGNRREVACGGAEGSMRNGTFDEPPVWVNTPNQYEGMQHPAVPDLESVQRAANKRGQ